MHIIKRLLLLATCIVTFGSASNSVFLNYSIETLDAQQIQDRQIEKNDAGFQIETTIQTYHPEVNSHPNEFSQKSKRSYTYKSAYY